MENGTIEPVNQETYNRRTIRLALHSEDLPAIDISDSKQVWERIVEYFDFCVSNNRFPCIAGMASWIGVHRDTLHSWKVGETRKSTHYQIIQRAYSIIEENIVSMLLENKITPTCGIFFLKILFGYRDRFDVGLEAATRQSKSPLDDLHLSDAEMESLRQKYLLDSLPEEKDPEEKGDD